MRTSTNPCAPAHGTALPPPPPRGGFGGGRAAAALALALGLVIAPPTPARAATLQVPMTADEAGGNAIVGTLRSIQRCWLPPPLKGPIPKVTIRFSLKADGSLDGDPVAVKTPAGPSAAAAVASAIRAVRLCAPFGLAADTYAKWRTNKVTFDPGSYQ